MVSVIIPSRNEIYLEPTIKSVLQSAKGEIEVIVILDGWLPNPPINTHDNRVKFYHFAEAQGQRQAVNYGAKIASGEYIMKLDAHCSVDEGFDIKLAENCQYDWTVVPRMYNLDPDTFRPKEFEDFDMAVRRRKVHDYMYVGFDEHDNIRTLYYPNNINRRLHMRPDIIDDTMSLMGCCFFMHKDRYWELEGLDENHGGWGQMGVEIALKAWLSGGALKVNKNTWFAHLFRRDKGGFPYKLTQNEIDKARTYSNDLWLNDKWHLAKRPLKWLIDKFNPPTWDKWKLQQKTKDNPINEKNEIIKQFNKIFFDSWNKYPRHWLGVKIVKYPTDLFIYQMLIYENKPDVIIETGSYRGGGALFFASICDLVGYGEVLSIDKRDIPRPKHERITYIIGRTTAVDTLEKVARMVEGKTCMVVLDSDHRCNQVKRELLYYSKFVSVGQYIIAEDTFLSDPDFGWKYAKTGDAGPKGAVEWFLKRHKNFIAEPLEDWYLISMCPGGFLKRIS